MIVPMKLDKSAFRPTYATPYSAGLDLYSSEDMVIYDGAIKMVPTGVYLGIPAGYEGQIRARSSMAKKGIMIPNAPGTIDADYRGEISVLLHNVSGDTLRIARGDRIAQLVVCPIQQVELYLVYELEETKRGTGGFGSTGV